MSLEFLHVDVALGGTGAQSPLARPAAAAGARFEFRDGWRVATSYGSVEQELRACREAVAWADLSHLGKVELQGSAADLEAVAAAAGLADAPERGRAARLDTGWWCPITPERVLVTCAPAAVAARRDELAEAGRGRVLDVTSAFGALVLLGPLAREAIARFCALDLRPAAAPVGALRPGSIARTPGLILVEAPDRYLLLFGAALGEYMWTVVADAAGALGGRAVGVDAVREEAGTRA